MKVSTNAAHNVQFKGFTTPTPHPPPHTHTIGYFLATMLDLFDWVNVLNFDILECFFRKMTIFRCFTTRPEDSKILQGDIQMESTLNIVLTCHRI